MIVPNTQERLITALREIPKGNIFTADEIAKKLNQMPKTIGRSIRGTGLAEYIPGARGSGKWKKL